MSLPCSLRFRFEVSSRVLFCKRRKLFSCFYWPQRRHREKLVHRSLSGLWPHSQHQPFGTTSNVCHFRVRGLKQCACVWLISHYSWDFRGLEIPRCCKTCQYFLCPRRSGCRQFAWGQCPRSDCYEALSLFDTFLSFTNCRGVFVELFRNVFIDSKQGFGGWFTELCQQADTNVIQTTTKDSRVSLQAVLVDTTFILVRKANYVNAVLNLVSCLECSSVPSG